MQTLPEIGTWPFQRRENPPYYILPNGQEVARYQWPCLDTLARLEVRVSF
jgi:hypothetical protein